MSDSDWDTLLVRHKMSCFQEIQDAVRKVNEKYQSVLDAIEQYGPLGFSSATIVRMTEMLEAIKNALHEIATEIVLIGAGKKK